MAKVQRTVSVHEKTVQKIAANAIAIYPRKKRARNSRVEVKMWTDGLDEMIVQYIVRHRIPRDRVKIVSPTEIIIKNPKD